MLDEMHVKENVIFKGNRLLGYVYYGTSSEDCDGFPKATQGLIFMLVAINSNCEIPIGYF